ncbi:hypothetical protein [Marinospirillum insulare]|uniref:Uncharacterized protein n=1 Tax=Marinospirillum insulare TaxID=217169 RepID=A0ABQ6A0A0_9GAMM|nr:hypothetical protein [Marinospirillum insulare]GLR65087.1 hypothetical protein GCM10007878_25260 [Marinospirillum insulare]
MNPRFERQAYSLLSKELTKEDYNEEIDSLADKAIDIVSEADNVIDKVTDENIFNDPYGSEGL